MNPSDLVYVPSQVVDLTHEYLDSLANKEKSRGVGIGIKRIDDYIMPFKGGDLVVVMGRPSHGKSSIMMHYARQATHKAVELGDFSVWGPSVYVTAEMAIEELSLKEVSHHAPIDSAALGRGNVEDWKRIHEVVDEIRSKSPLIYMGHSVKHARRRPEITIENIWEGTEYLVDKYNIKPSYICLDYLQRLKLANGMGWKDRRMEMNEIVNRAKDLALAFDCVVALGVQAGRQVDERVPPVPDIGDGLETSAIEQVPEFVLSMWRPSKTIKLGEFIPKTEIQVTENLFYLKVLKQRNGRAGQGFFLHFDMSVSKLADMEIVRYNTDQYNDEEREDEDGETNLW